METGKTATTRLLERMRAGDARAAGELAPLVYSELHEIAERCMREQRGGHTLQPTALVHEAWLRIAGPGAGFDDRAHFLAVAARAMRNLLVDHARARSAEKRGRRAEISPADALVAVFEQRSLDLVAIDAALEKLARIDVELLRVVELRFFAGLSIAETATVLGVSTPTVERSWRSARAWLRREVPDAREG